MHDSSTLGHHLPPGLIILPACYRATTCPSATPFPLSFVCSINRNALIFGGRVFRVIPKIKRFPFRPMKFLSKEFRGSGDAVWCGCGYEKIFSSFSFSSSPWLSSPHYLQVGC